MEIVHSVLRMQALSKRYRAEGSTIAFVPTMGFLHEGHLSLVRQAKKMAEMTVVSIFVNPTQFGPAEDFEDYPRDLIHDLDMLKEARTDIVFNPEPGDIYPKDFETKVTVTKSSSILCGAARPGHFDGVATIVSKLFNIISPNYAIFGRKDYQQAFIIKRMVRDLNFPVEIFLSPTVRESDGLAMSSRNSYLNADERNIAPLIYRSLKEGEKMLQENWSDLQAVRERIMVVIGGESDIHVEYLELLDAETLAPPKDETEEILIAVAAKLGRTRLIDNITVKKMEKE